MYVYIYILGVAVDSGKGLAEHAALCVSMFHHDPNRPRSKSFASRCQTGGSGCPVLDQAPETD